MQLLTISPFPRFGETQNKAARKNVGSKYMHNAIAGDLTKIKITTYKYIIPISSSFANNKALRGSPEGLCVIAANKS